MLQLILVKLNHAIDWFGMPTKDLAIYVGGIANIWLGFCKSKGYTFIVSNVASFLFFTGVGFVVIIFICDLPNNSIFKCLRCLMCRNLFK